MVPTAQPVNHVLFFARAPRRGQVKTRLAADVGPEAALEIYRSIGSRVARQVEPVSSITVWYEPAEAGEEVREWLGDLRYQAQPAGDLGARMAYAFDTHFATCPSEPAIAIGADAPGVDADVIVRAGRALCTSDVVIGPASDGGYYLIGLARPLPELFAGISWGTAQVYEATRAACRSAGIVPVILPELRDVDRLDDLTALGLWPS
jgi:rSAM/selenodomain-associated transferase 1